MLLLHQTGSVKVGEVVRCADYDAMPNIAAAGTLTALQIYSYLHTF